MHHQHPKGTRKPPNSQFKPILRSGLACITYSAIGIAISSSHTYLWWELGLWERNSCLFWLGQSLDNSTSPFEVRIVLNCGMDSEDPWAQVIIPRGLGLDLVDQEMLCEI